MAIRTLDFGRKLDLFGKSEIGVSMPSPRTLSPPQQTVPGSKWMEFKDGPRSGRSSGSDDCDAIPSDLVDQEHGRSNTDLLRCVEQVSQGRTMLGVGH
jgi:hypothetical protein